MPDPIPDHEPKPDDDALERGEKKTKKTKKKKKKKDKPCEECDKDDYGCVNIHCQTMCMRGMFRLIYAGVALTVTLSVLLLLFVDLIFIHSMDSFQVIGLAGTIVTLWAQSPAQPMIDQWNEHTERLKKPKKL